MTLAQFCKEKRISNIAGAEILGIDSSHFCNIKVGRSKCSQELLAKIGDWTYDMCLPRDFEKAHAEFHGK